MAARCASVNRVQSLSVPVLAVCGYSGAGKTTLLLQLVPRLRARGLEVGVVKHDAHGVVVDQEGKDSDRLFRAGAHVLLRAPNQTFGRWHPSPLLDLPWALAQLASQVDLVLVEGHKDTPLPKVWLEHPHQPARPPLEQLLAILPWGEERLAQVEDLLETQLRLQKPPLYTGILLGGQSRRMGRPKQSLRLAGKSLLARLAEVAATHARPVIYLGQGAIPADAPSYPLLPDPPGPGGPLAGMVAALRWHPQAQWLFVPTDAVALKAETLAWLTSLWQPGVWGVLPRRPSGQLEPLPALLAPQLRRFLEERWRAGAGPRELARHAKVITPEVPGELEGSLLAVNTPEEWEKARRAQSKDRRRKP